MAPTPTINLPGWAYMIYWFSHVFPGYTLLGRIYVRRGKFESPAFHYTRECDALIDRKLIFTSTVKIHEVERITAYRVSYTRLDYAQVLLRGARGAGHRGPFVRCGMSGAHAGGRTCKNRTADFFAKRPQRYKKPRNHAFSARERSVRGALQSGSLQPKSGILAGMDSSFPGKSGRVGRYADMTKAKCEALFGHHTNNTLCDKCYCHHHDQIAAFQEQLTFQLTLTNTVSASNPLVSLTSSEDYNSTTNIDEGTDEGFYYRFDEFYNTLEDIFISMTCIHISYLCTCYSK